MSIRKWGDSLDSQQKSLEESQIAREIVKQIIKTDPSYATILYIIDDLSIHLEMPEHAKIISEACKKIVGVDEEQEESSISQEDGGLDLGGLEV